MASIQEKIQRIRDQQAELNAENEGMQRALARQSDKERCIAELNALKVQEAICRKKAGEEVSEIKKQEYLLQAARVKETQAALMQKIELLDEELAKFNLPEQCAKNFDKYRCFSNIRELMKDRDVKIGQIEREAGCQPGYMSRLEKPNNNSEPSVEFVVTAAKLLGVSIDTLLTTDLASITPTEKYLLTFFDKLQKDTTLDKIEWNRETADELNFMDPDINGWVDHPLFGQETFLEEGDSELPDEITRIVFASKSFGPHTCINGDCFHFRMKNGVTVYLMDISKSIHNINDSEAVAKEVWIHTPNQGSQCLACSKSISPLSVAVEPLFSAVVENMKHPKINKSVQYAIDAFMKDDIEDDAPTGFSIDEELPFN